MRSQPITTKIRARLQEFGLQRIHNSPKKQVQKEVYQHIAASQQQQSVAGEGSTREAAQCVAHASSTTPNKQSSATTSFSTETGVAAIDALRARAQEAMRLKIAATLRHFHALTQQSSSPTTSTTTSPSTAQTTTTTTTPSSSSCTTSAPSPTDSSILPKLHHVLQERRQPYYSTIPFDDRWNEIMRGLEVLGRTSQHNHVVPFRNSGDAYTAMWAAVDGAQREVLWQTYICKDDHVGQTTVRKMAEARRERGCTLELLYDCGGNISGRTRLMEQITQCGGTVIRFRPFFVSFVRYVCRGCDWRRSPGLRNHRKILIVDGKIGFCGGLNIGNEYCGTSCGGSGRFRDTHCSVVGPAVAHLREVYEDTKRPHPWRHALQLWRQIASAQLNRRYQRGRRRITTSVIGPLQQQGRVHLRRTIRAAEKETVRMIERIRWQKQREQLLRVVRSINNTLDATALMREEPVEESGRTKSSATTTTTPPTSNTATPSSGASSCVQATTSNTSNTTPHHSHKTVADYDAPASPHFLAMKQRILSARLSSLTKLRPHHLLHKRSYTKMLLQLPIADSDPVPEAEAYNTTRPSTTQILSCNPRFHDYSIQYAFWQVTRKCHRRIWITTPYYLPTKKLFKALLQAAQRGVDVRILAGSCRTTDPPFMWHASNYVTHRLLQAGVRIYEYHGNGVMHAKTVVVDSLWSSIGSYNWDVMSNKNLEVCLSHMDYAVAREMESQFLLDLAESKEVELCTHCQRSVWLRCTSWLVYHVLYVLDKITFHAFRNPDLIDFPK